MYSEGVNMAFKAKFGDNDVIDVFRILNPIHMLKREFGLSSYNVAQLGELLKQFREEKKILSPLVDAIAYKEEFIASKLHNTFE